MMYGPSDREEKLELALRTLLDQVDFRKGACALMDPIGSLIPPTVFILCDEALNAHPK